MDLQLSRPGRFSFAPHRRPQASGEVFFEHGNITYSPIISGACTLPRTVGACHNVNLVAQMIESEQPVKEHQFAIRQGQVIFCMLTDVFQLPSYIVRKIDYSSCRNAGGSFAAMDRNAETGVSKSALADFTTGTSGADRARRENSLNSGLIMDTKLDK